MAAPESRLSRWASRLRALTFTALAGWILLAPGQVQVLGGSGAIARPDPGAPRSTGPGPAVQLS